jgi:hypothetical protein
VRSPEHDIIAIDLDGDFLGEDPPEGEIVLKAKQWEAQKVPHQLPLGLHRDVHVRVLNPTSQVVSRCLPDRRRDRLRHGLEHVKYHIGNFNPKVVRRALIITRNKNLPVLPREPAEPTRFGFTAKKPRALGEFIVQAPVKRVQKTHV